MIKEQYQSGHTLNQHKYHAIFRRSDVHPIMHDIYPLGLEYYHELNPAFTFNVSRPEYFEFCKTMTIKDGAATLAAFLANQFYNIPRFKTHFIIHQSLSHLVPHNLKDHFSCWSLRQPGQLEIRKAKRVILAGIGTDQTLGSIEEIENKLKILQGLSLETEIEIYLPVRKNPLDTWKENYISYKFIEILKKILPEHKLNYLETQTLLERPSFRHTYMVDLLPNTFTIADSFLNYLVASRGGTVSSFSTAEAPQKIFELDLSLHHRLEITPLPEVNSLFAELLFYKKQSGSSDLMFDQGFLNIVRKG
jgi:hypothetical protein